MDKTIFSSVWRNELALDVISGANSKVTLDFNRLLYYGCPTKNEIESGLSIGADREHLILILKDSIDADLESGNNSSSTLYAIYAETMRYLIWVDKNSSQAFTSTSLKLYFEHNLELVRLHKIKGSRYGIVRSSISRLFKRLNLDSSWFENVPVVPKTDIEPYEAYSKGDLKKLLPLIRQIFKQLSKQFLDDPKKYICGSKRTTKTMMFIWEGEEHKIQAGISKMMVAAIFLLSYYTSCNPTQLYSLKRPQQVSLSTKKAWYTMPAFKRRAFKIIHVEMGDSGSIDVPKYSMDFFDTLLKVSELIDPNPGALLIQTIVNKIPTALNGVFLNDFNVRFFHKCFSIKDDRGRKLSPVVSRFRQTGSKLVEHHLGPIAKGVVLNNSLAIRNIHYSEGNKFENSKMMQETVSIREEQAKSNVSTSEARQNLQIKILTIEELAINSSPYISKSAHGSYCTDPFGEKSEQYRRKFNLQQLSDGKKLACADLLACFGCQFQVIVQSVDDIWCLLSFKQCIEESLYLHLDNEHYRKNFSEKVNYIEHNILSRINNKIFKKAENKLNNAGRHPLWQETDFIQLFINKERR